MNIEMTRREICASSLKSVLLAKLGLLAFANKAFSKKFETDLIRWINRFNDAAHDLKDDSLPQSEGLRVLNGFFDNVDIADFCQFIDFDKLIRGIQFPSDREYEETFQYPKVEGIPGDVHFKSQIVAMKRDRSIPPHGHNNQITGFLTLSGELHGKHYDRTDVDEDRFILTPTIDASFQTGSFSMISDEKDNVHWFRTLSDRAFLLNVVVTPLNNRPAGGRVHMDLRGGELPNGKIKATKISGRQAYDIYW